MRRRGPGRAAACGRRHGTAVQVAGRPAEVLVGCVQRPAALAFDEPTDRPEDLGGGGGGGLSCGLRRRVERVPAGVPDVCVGTVHGVLGGHPQPASIHVGQVRGRARWGAGRRACPEARPAVAGLLRSGCLCDTFQPWASGRGCGTLTSGWGCARSGVPSAVPGVRRQSMKPDGTPVAAPSERPSR